MISINIPVIFKIHLKEEKENKKNHVDVKNIFSKEMHFNSFTFKISVRDFCAKDFKAKKNQREKLIFTISEVVKLSLPFSFTFFFNFNEKRFSLIIPFYYRLSTL